MKKEKIHSKLASRFVRHVLFIALITTILMTLFFSYDQYQRKLAKINDELDTILQVNQATVTQSLWILDTHALNLIVKGFLLQREIVFAQITDDQGHIVASQGNAGNGDTIEKTIDLYHNDSGKKTFIGQLTLIATKKVAMRDIESSFGLTLLQSMLLILIIVVYVLYIFRDFISKHLIRIHRYTSQLVIGKDQPPLTLDRITNKRNSGDELDQLVGSINYMFQEANKSYHRVEYQALHDELTDLYNRRAIEQRINTLITDNGGMCHALALIDLDHFKLINESQGHHVGDQVLKKIASRLLHSIAENNIVARSGGDEFVLIIENLTTDREEAGKLANLLIKDILAAIQQPLKIDGSEYHVSACAGIEIFNEKIDFKTILKHAENALHHAKIKGVNQVALFYSDMQFARDKRMQIETLLRNAIKNNRMIINYQPKCTKDGTIYSAEALVRMIDEDGRMVSPADFIPIAEETGLISELGEQIINKVFECIANHQALMERSAITSISINISPTQFSNSHFHEQITEQARQYGIPRNFIILEITEEAVVSDIQHIIDTMHTIKHSGFKLSIDDFGTGYSSLNYLQKFPLDELKIDKSFIDEVTVNDRAQAIIKTILDMARHLGFEVVAEGVETFDQLELLNNYGCNFFQGYVFYKPLSETDFLEKLKNQAETL